VRASTGTYARCGRPAVATSPSACRTWPDEVVFGRGPTSWPAGSARRGAGEPGDEPHLRAERDGCTHLGAAHRRARGAEIARVLEEEFESEGDRRPPGDRRPRRARRGPKGWSMAATIAERVVLRVRSRPAAGWRSSERALQPDAAYGRPRAGGERLVSWVDASGRGGRCPEPVPTTNAGGGVRRRPAERAGAGAEFGQGQPSPAAVVLAGTRRVGLERCCGGCAASSRCSRGTPNVGCSRPLATRSASTRCTGRAAAEGWRSRRRWTRCSPSRASVATSIRLRWPSTWRNAIRDERRDVLRGRSTLSARHGRVGRARRHRAGSLLVAAAARGEVPGCGTTTRRVRRGFTRAVARNVGSRRPALFLSGGLDSIAVGAAPPTSQGQSGRRESRWRSRSGSRNPTATNATCSGASRATSGSSRCSCRSAGRSSRPVHSVGVANGRRLAVPDVERLVTGIRRAGAGGT
jgi:hypothetical protein